jgi:hypothetical protein
MIHFPQICGSREQSHFPLYGHDFSKLIILSKNVGSNKWTPNWTKLIWEDQKPLPDFCHATWPCHVTSMNDYGNYNSI